MKNKTKESNNNDTAQAQKQHSLPLPPSTLRPRILYSAIFTWLSITGGRFFAPFLEQEANFSDSVVGAILATQFGLASILGSAGGALADKLEKRIENGRVIVLSSGILLGTLSFFLHGAGHVIRGLSPTSSPSNLLEGDLSSGDSHRQKELIIIIWHFMSRIIYSIAMALVMPVMDGLTLAHLERDPKSNQTDYGKERLYGAVWWGIANVVAGPCIDKWGFNSMYVLALITATACYITLWAYARQMTKVQRNGGIINERKEDSMKMTAATSMGAIDASTTYPQSDAWESSNEGSDCMNLDSDHSRGLEAVSKYQNSKCFVESNGTSSVSNTDHECLKETAKDPSLWALLKLLLGTIYGVGFLFSYFCLAAGMNIVENLVFLYFEFLGGSYTMCGVTVVMTVALEIPIFFIAPGLLRSAGPTIMQHVACAAFVIRVIGYTLIPEKHVWLAYVFELLHGVSYACSQASAVEFTAQLMPEGYEASGQGLLAFFRGLGAVVGLSMGGWAQQALGPRTMYRGLASIVLLGMIVFAFASKFQSTHQFDSTPHSAIKDKEKHDESKPLSRSNQETAVSYTSIT